MPDASIWRIPWRKSSSLSTKFSNSKAEKGKQNFELAEQAHSQIHYAIGGPIRALANVELAMVRAALDAAVFAEAFATGQQLSLEEAFTTILTALVARGS